MHGHQGADWLVSDASGCQLEGIQHGAFAIRQVGTSGANLADFLEDFLYQLEVIGDKRIVGRKAFCRVKVAQVRAEAVEADLVAQDIALVIEQFTQLQIRRVCFQQQAFLNDFVGVGA